MKDWLRVLGLPPDADTEAIRLRLNADPPPDPQARHAARDILLRPDRRPIYDAARTCATKVARIRAALAITDTLRWRSSAWQDFAPSPSQQRALRRALAARVARPYLWRAGIGISLVLAATALAFLIMA